MRGVEFSPQNPVVRLCLQGKSLDAWEAATCDFERFLAAYFVARDTQGASEKLRWFELALQFALQVGDEATLSALPSVHSEIAQCYEDLGDAVRARESSERATSSRREPTDPGPFFHGTKADLKVGDLLTSGRSSNYKDDLQMNHVYFTALPSGAGLAAALAKGGEGPGRVYVVEPTGSFEPDPNVTDKKFPGNLTRSYRSQAPLKVVGELKDWDKLSPQEIQAWREKLAKSTGEIIN